MRPIFKLMMLMCLVVPAEFMPGLCHASDTITAAEIEHFEQTWESWARDIVQGIHPALKFTVITRIEFSQNPEQIENYEDMKTVGHLPGLPEVADPNYTRPLDSPLYALVAKKHIRIIFHESMNNGEKNLIEEVVKAKMKLGSTDDFTTEVIPIAQSVDTNQAPKPAISLLFGLFMLSILGLLFFSHRKRNLRATTTDIKPSETPVPQASLVAPSPAPEALIPAHYQILNADPVVRRHALSREKIETIAKASVNCSTRFSNELLGELEQHQFDLVNQWLVQNKRIVTLAESNYARILIAARIQQIGNQKILSAISTLKTRAKNPETSV
jgi:hypothetical protein